MLRGVEGVPVHANRRGHTGRTQEVATGISTSAVAHPGRATAEREAEAGDFGGAGGEERQEVMARCRALDNKGRQCHGKGIGEYSFSGDSEMDSWQHIGWVLVPFCKKHIEQMDEKETHTQMMARFRKERLAEKLRKNARIVASEEAFRDLLAAAMQHHDFPSRPWLQCNAVTQEAYLTKAHVLLPLIRVRVAEARLLEIKRSRVLINNKAAALADAVSVVERGAKKGMA